MFSRKNQSSSGPEWQSSAEKPPEPARPPFGPITAPLPTSAHFGFKPDSFPPPAQETLPAAHAPQPWETPDPQPEASWQNLSPEEIWLRMSSDVPAPEASAPAPAYLETSFEHYQPYPNREEFDFSLSGVPEDQSAPGRSAKPPVLPPEPSARSGFPTLPSSSYSPSGMFSGTFENRTDIPLDSEALLDPINHRLYPHEALEGMQAGLEAETRAFEEASYFLFPETINAPLNWEDPHLPAPRLANEAEPPAIELGDSFQTGERGLNELSQAEEDLTQWSTFMPTGEPLSHDEADAAFHQDFDFFLRATQAEPPDFPELPSSPDIPAPASNLEETLPAFPQMVFPELPSSPDIPAPASNLEETLPAFPQMVFPERPSSPDIPVPASSLEEPPPAFPQMVFPEPPSSPDTPATASNLEEPPPAFLDMADEDWTPSYGQNETPGELPASDTGYRSESPVADYSDNLEAAWFSESPFQAASLSSSGYDSDAFPPFAPPSVPLPVDQDFYVAEFTFDANGTLIPKPEDITVTPVFMPRPEEDISEAASLTEMPPSPADKPSREFAEDFAPEEPTPNRAIGFEDIAGAHAFAEMLPSPADKPSRESAEDFAPEEPAPNRAVGFEDISGANAFTEIPPSPADKPSRESAEDLPPEERAPNRVVGFDESLWWAESPPSIMSEISPVSEIPTTEQETLANPRQALHMSEPITHELLAMESELYAEEPDAFPLPTPPEASRPFLEEPPEEPKPELEPEEEPKAVPPGRAVEAPSTDLDLLWEMPAPFGDISPDSGETPLEEPAGSAGIPEDIPPAPTPPATGILWPETLTSLWNGGEKNATGPESGQPQESQPPEMQFPEKPPVLNAPPDFTADESSVKDWDEPSIALPAEPSAEQPSLPLASPIARDSQPQQPLLEEVPPPPGPSPVEQAGIAAMHARQPEPQAEIARPSIEPSAKAPASAPVQQPAASSASSAIRLGKLEVIGICAVNPDLRLLVVHSDDVYALMSQMDRPQSRVSVLKLFETNPIAYQTTFVAVAERKSGRPGLFSVQVGLWRGMLSIFQDQVALYKELG